MCKACKIASDLLGRLYMCRSCWRKAYKNRKKKK